MKVMKNKAITIVCAAAIGLATATPAVAAPEKEPTAVAADAVIMRPALFAATIAGSAVFVVILPIAAISKSIKSTAQALVVAPGKATFTRALGDFDYEKSPSDNELAASY
jgi:hypothetical protein